MQHIKSKIHKRHASHQKCNQENVGADCGEDGAREQGFKVYASYNSIHDMQFNI